MKINIYKNKNKNTDEQPDFIGTQRQRDGTGYKEVDVAVGFTCEDPRSEKYISLSIDGITDVAYNPKDYIKKDKLREIKTLEELTKLL